MFSNYLENIVILGLLFALVLFFLGIPDVIVSFLLLLYLLTTFVIAIVVTVKDK